MNDLVHIEAEVRSLGQGFQVMSVWHSEARLNKFVLKCHIIVQYIC